MWAMGLLPEEGASAMGLPAPTLGLECAGIVRSLSARGSAAWLSATGFMAICPGFVEHSRG